RIEDGIEEEADPVQILSDELEGADNGLDDFHEPAAGNEEPGDPQNAFLDEGEKDRFLDAVEAGLNDLLQLLFDVVPERDRPSLKQNHHGFERLVRECLDLVDHLHELRAKNS